MEFPVPDFIIRRRRRGWILGMVLIAGALTPAARGAGAPSDRPALQPARGAVPLPPFLVEESRSRRPWRYASCPGLEVLSRCPDDVTEGIVGQYFRLHALLALMLPPEFQGHSDVPVNFIVYDADAQGTLARGLVDRLKSLAEEHHDGDYAVMPNFRLWDQDSLAIFFSVDSRPSNRRQLETTGLTLTADYLRFRLTTRTPTLPGWFVEGMLELYKGVELVAPPTSRTHAFDWGGGLEQPSQRVSFPSFVWISPEETKRLRHDPSTMPLLPLADLFAVPPWEEAPAAQAQRAAEAALFIRWALDPKKPGATAPAADGVKPLPPQALQAAALWSFVRQVAAGVPAADAFEASFGVGFTEFEPHLAAYRLVATGMFNGFKLPLDTVEPPDVALREASAAEVGRIKGRLERLDVRYVRALAPSLVPQYEAQAQATLHRALEHAAGDPRLLAELGLCEADGGDDASARPVLAAAAAAGVVHPRVYGELARIEFEQAETATPAEPAGPAAAAARALAWLDRADTQAPALWENDYLRARILARHRELITPAGLARLRTGAALFPDNAVLGYAVALVHAIAGDRKDARTLLGRTMAVTRKPAALARLRQLEEALAGPAGPGK